LGGRRLHEELRLRNRRLKWNVRQEHGRYLFRKVARLDSGVCLEFVHPGDLDCECRWAQEDRGPEQESVIEKSSFGLKRMSGICSSWTSRVWIYAL